MLIVKINGKESQINGNHLPTIADLLELVKTGIDPSHIISGALLDSEELTDEDWSRAPSQLSGKVLEISTGSAESFVVERLKIAGDVVREVYVAFRDARKAFQNGDMMVGNELLVPATKSLKAFFEWYVTITMLVPEDRRTKVKIHDRMENITVICNRICQQQLYQSWWALGETIEKELEPELDRLETFCLGLKKLSEQSLVTATAVAI